MRISAHKARRLRDYIAHNRCPLRPGYLHSWVLESALDPMSFGSVIEWYECEKCHEVER